MSLDASDFTPITKANARKKLSRDGLEDMFDMQLAYRSVPLKQYIRKMIV